MKHIAFLLLPLTLITSCTTTSTSITPPKDPEAYYNGLKATCGDSRCCLTSVNQMKNKGAVEAPANGCENGKKVGSLTCDGSKKWCETSDVTASGTAK